MADNKKVFRVIDVNINRVKEALRCCEEIARFMLDNAELTKAFKAMRHEIEAIVVSSAVRKRALYKSRDIRNDCARAFCALEKKSDWQSVFFANAQRAKEALRVLEEFFKLVDNESCAKFKALRFKLYEQEKRLAERYLK